MKDKFAWYLPQNASEFNNIWDNAILTLDTNVLLDLYRVHSNTKDTLISAINSFGDRVWLSYQAASEFIEHHNEVKFDSKSIFDNISPVLSNLKQKIEADLNEIKGKKVLDKTKLDSYKNEIITTIDSIDKYLEESKEIHLKTLTEDKILEWITNKFNNKVGQPIADDNREIWNNEAKTRIEAKIPPGYKDKDKDDEKSYGDIFLWKQVLNYAKEIQTPIILITSEKKEDWWAKSSNQIIGPRLEMLKEAFDIAQQKVFIFRTEYFLELYAKRQGQEENTHLTEAIREFSQLFDENRFVSIKEQVLKSNNRTFNEGKLIVELKRPTSYFTVSGHLNPKMCDIPKISANLVESPEDMPSYKIKEGTGTCYDFNIHIKTQSPNQFPSGLYTFEYKALCNNQDKSNLNTMVSYNHHEEDTPLL